MPAHWYQPAPASNGVTPLLWYDFSEPQGIYSDDAGTVKITNGVGIALIKGKGSLGDATAPSVPTRPLWVASAINGKGAMRAAAGTRLHTPSLTGVTVPVVMLAVVSNITALATQVNWVGGIGPQLGLQPTSSNFFMHSGSFVDSGVVGDTGATFLVVALFNGVSSKIRIGGGAGTAGDSGASGFSGVESLGAYIDGQFAFTSGDIGEYIMLSGNTPVGPINSFAQYLANKWQATASWTPAT